MATDAQFQKRCAQFHKHLCVVTTNVERSGWSGFEQHFLTGTLADQPPYRELLANLRTFIYIATEVPADEGPLFAPVCDFCAYVTELLLGQQPGSEETEVRAVEAFESRKMDAIQGAIIDVSLRLPSCKKGALQAAGLLLAHLKTMQACASSASWMKATSLAVGLQQILVRSTQYPGAAVDRPRKQIMADYYSQDTPKGRTKIRERARTAVRNMAPEMTFSPTQPLLQVHRKLLARAIPGICIDLINNRRTLEKLLCDLRHSLHKLSASLLQDSRNDCPDSADD
jgi:hypothetical protein